MRKNKKTDMLRDALLGYLRQQTRNGVMETPQPVVRAWAVENLPSVSDNWVINRLLRYESDRIIVRRPSVWEDHFCYMLSLPGVVSNPLGRHRKRRVYMGMRLGDCTVDIAHVSVKIPERWVMHVLTQLTAHIRRMEDERGRKERGSQRGEGSSGPGAKGRDEVVEDGRATKY